MKQNRIPLIIIAAIFAIILNACSLLPKFLTGTQTQQLTPTASGPGASSASGAPVEIGSLYAHTDSFGYLHVVGEITNVSSSVINNIELAVSLKDASGATVLKDYDGNTVDSVALYPFVYTLAPGDSSPFDFSYYEEGTPGSYEVFYVSSDTTTATKGSVEIRNTHYVDDGSDTIYYFGELVNTGSTPVEISGFSVGLKDASGMVKAASSSMNLVQYLAPAGDEDGLDSGPFGVTINAVPEDGLTPQVYFYPRQADAREKPMLELAFTNSYNDYYDRVHVVGVVKNSDTRQLGFPVQVALRDENGVILDTYYVNMPVSLDPGESLPFDVNYWYQINSNADDQGIMSNLYMQIDPYWTWETTYEYKILSASAVNLEDTGDGTLHITGTTRNDSGVDLYSITVMIWFTDAEDYIVGTAYTSLFPSGDGFAQSEEADIDFYANLDPEANYTDYDYTLQVIGQVK